VSFSTEPYLAWEFDMRTANCWHFAREVWRELTGVLLVDHTPDSLRPEEMTFSAVRQATALRRVALPCEPCLVLMQRLRIEPHVGVYIGRRVLHCTRFGAAYQPLDHVTVGYPTVTFYTNPP
jgi:hypothetical protein